MLTRSEEDHIKAVYALLQDGDSAFTKDIAERMRTKASGVTDMLKKLAEKGYLKHEPYYGVKLSAKGQSLALQLVRRHRLWETFLVERLGFGWDQVHDVAEQLEHVASKSSSTSWTSIWVIRTSTRTATRYRTGGANCAFARHGG